MSLPQSGHGGMLNCLISSLSISASASGVMLIISAVNSGLKYLM